jgi:hypothetical protein
MALIHGTEKLLSLSARKRFGFSHSFGSAHFGYTRFGDFNVYSGIYQKHNTPAGKRDSRMQFYWPTNPQTSPQQAWRAVFAQGFSDWGGLTPTEKAEYNRRARSRKMSGFNLFMREYLLSHN